VSELVKKLIRDIPDFPKKGILFKDITPIFADPKGLDRALALMASAVPSDAFDLVAGIESRGFFFAPAIARELNKGFIPMRKPGKLPYKTVGVTYRNEYGEDRIEVHADAFASGQRVLVVDDLLATGGTARAACQLVEQAGASVAGTLFLVELGFLEGRDALSGRKVTSIIIY